MFRSNRCAIRLFIAFFTVILILCGCGSESRKEIKSLIAEIKEKYKENMAYVESKSGILAFTVDMDSPEYVEAASKVAEDDKEFNELLDRFQKLGESLENSSDRAWAEKESIELTEWMAEYNKKLNE